MLYDSRGRLYDPRADMIERPCLTRAELRGASSWLLNTRGAPAIGADWQADAPSVWQNLPPDADTLLRWLGGGAYPAGIVAADVQGAYQCDTGSPLVDSLGFGPALPAFGGGELTGRECVGLGQVGSFTSKVGVEFPDNNSEFISAGGTDFGAVPVNAQRSFLFVIRPRDNYEAFNRVFSFWGWNNGWYIWRSAANLITLAIYDPGAHTASVIAPLTCQWMYACIAFDDVTKTANLYTPLGDSGPLAYANSIIDANANRYFSLGYAIGPGGSAMFQCAAFWRIDKLVTKAMCDAFWRHAQVPIPYLHARTNPLICPISAHRVACWGGGNVGQAAIGYDASLVDAAQGNPLGSGYVCEDGATFEPIGSTDFYTNTGLVGGCTKASVDGPSAMRDGLRATQGGAWASSCANYLTVVGGIVGVSNIPWRLDVNYRRATVGTTARAGFVFAGSGGGTEFFTLVSDAASPVDWLRAGGTCTPVNADQTACYPVFGAAANLDDCDFGEPAVIKNRTTPSLAWRRVGIVAAAQTTTPAYLMVNAGNAYYSPLRGRIRLTVGGFQGTNGAVFLQFGAAASAGSLTLDYNAGVLRIQVYDSTPALVAAINCGAINTARHALVIDYDSTAPIRGAAAGGHIIVSEAGVILGEGAAANWVVPTAAVTPLNVGSAGGVNAARCFIELNELRSTPGSVT